MGTLPPQVLGEIGKIVTAEGLELVNVEFKPAPGGHLLRIDIDKEGGITIEDCQLISKQISTFLDVDDSIPGTFELQVSSPGLDRKFYKDSDYQRFQGRLVRVKTAVPVRGLHVVVGRLSGFDGERIVVVDPGNRRDYDISLKDIKETRLEIEF
jgi:ribosome maturation factor RimP